MLQNISFKLSGVSPLLMNNGRTADPTSRFAKQVKSITSKRKKTDEDHLELQRIEWHAGLYVDSAEQLIVTADMLDACLVEGAKKSKLGKAFKSAVFVERDAVLSIGTKYLKASDLYENKAHRDVRAVRVGTNRIMRCRPIFRDWSCDVDVQFDDEQINCESLVRAMEDAGRQVGLGDYRPRYGRFEVKAN